MKKTTTRPRKKGGMKKVLIGFLALGLISSIGKTSNSTEVPSSEVTASFSTVAEIDAASFELQNGLTDGMAHLDFPDVGTYEGNLQNGKRTGEGTFAWTDGTTYAGTWSDDQINGDGVVTAPNGTKWSGTFVNNSFQNASYTVTGSNFSGTVTIADEKNQTNLTFTYPDPADSKKTINVTYSGDLTKAGEFTGNATIGYPNGDSYTGTVSNGQKVNGKYTFKNGDSYTGTFNADKMCDGTYSFSTGQTLTGHFENGIPNGELTYTVSGVKYKTTWKNGACASITKA